MSVDLASCDAGCLVARETYVEGSRSPSNLESVLKCMVSFCKRNGEDELPSCRHLAVTVSC